MKDIAKATQINISIFGPADHGKSSLVGYLFTKYNGYPDFDFDKEIKQFKREIGNFYREDRKYTYFVDRYDVERMGDPSQGHKDVGVSRYSKTLTMIIDKREFRFVDSPGHYKWRKEASKAIVVGNYRVFVIALDDIEKDYDVFENLINTTENFFPSSLRRYLIPLFIAIKLSLKINVIALTKADKISYDKTRYERCEYIIKRLIEKYFPEEVENTKILPIAIDIKNNISENIDSTSDKMPYYHGSSLVEIIKSFKRQDIDDGEVFFMPIQKIDFNRPGHKIILTGKIEIGQIQKLDSVLVSPIFSQKNITYAEGKIKAIFCDDISMPINENDNIISASKANDIISLSVNVERKVVDYLKNEIRRLPPLVITSVNSPPVCGRYICFKINFHRDYSFVFGREYQLLVNGKYVSATFIGFDISSGNAPEEYTYHWFKTERVISAIKIDNEEIIGLNIVIIDDQERGGSTSLQIFRIDKVIYIDTPNSIFVYLFKETLKNKKIRNYYDKLLSTLSSENYFPDEDDGNIILQLSYNQFEKIQNDLQLLSRLFKNSGSFLVCEILK